MSVFYTQRPIGRKSSREEETVINMRAKLMFASLSSDLKPLFDWLQRLSVLEKVEVDEYLGDPSTFFKQLRNGFILSKLGIVAIDMKSSFYSNYVSSSAQTR